MINVIKHKSWIFNIPEIFSTIVIKRKDVANIINLFIGDLGPTITQLRKFEK